MSVDCSARLRYGWYVTNKKLTDKFKEQLSFDFCGDEESGLPSLDGKYEKSLGTYYTGELADCVDAYSDESDYVIGVDVDTSSCIGENGVGVRFEPFNAGDFASKVLELMKLDEELRKLYWDLMGEEPPSEPRINLYESWW